MKKLKLKTFSNWMEKTKVRVGDKVIKLREERELLGRFLIIQGSRPELVPRLEETIGEYEMAVVLRSLCTVDGSLFIPTDKASLMRLIEEANPQAQLETPPATGNLHRIFVVDAMAVVPGNYNIDNFNNNNNKNSNNSNNNNNNNSNNNNSGWKRLDLPFKGGYPHRPRRTGTWIQRLQQKY